MTKTLTLTNFSLILVIFTMLMVLLREQQIIKDAIIEVKEQNIIIISQIEPPLPEWEEECNLSQPEL
jgi:amino acid permease